MCDFEFDPKDIERTRRFRNRFDRYCKKTIYNAAHNLVLMQTQFLMLQYGADDVDPELALTEDDHGDLYACRLSVRGKEVLIRNERLAKMLMRLQARKREILLMFYMLDMDLDEIAEELGIAYETAKSTKSKAIRELRKGVKRKDEKA